MKSFTLPFDVDSVGLSQLLPTFHCVLSDPHAKRVTNLNTWLHLIGPLGLFVRNLFQCWVLSLYLVHVAVLILRHTFKDWRRRNERSKLGRLKTIDHF